MQIIMIRRIKPVRVNSTGVINFKKKKIRTIIINNTAVPMKILPAVLTTPKIISNSDPNSVA
jgi:hypothetical protein